MNDRAPQQTRGGSAGSQRKVFGRRSADPLICMCNEVPKSAIDAAMRNGATTLAEIFDQTFAGCGPCGGSCQPELVQLLSDHLRRCQGQ